MIEHKTSIAAYMTAVWTAIAGFFSTITANDVAIYVGIASTLATFYVNYHFKRKEMELRKLEIERDHERTPFPTLHGEDQ